ncbi:MAG: DinB family protein [Acidimicrobiia bacterium]
MGVELPPYPDGELPEREMLEQFLQWYRAVVVRKVEGLPRELAIRPMPPGILSALGIVKHLGWVERGWSRRAILGEDYPVPWNDADPDADLRIEDDETVESVLAWYRSEWEAADAIWSARSLDDTGLDHERLVSIRWILVHMIEETARHAGHLDLIVEPLDGRTGD